MPYAYTAVANSLGADWEPIYANTTPGAIALVRLVFNAPGSGGNLWIKVTTPTTEFPAIGSATGLPIAGGLLLAGYPAIALATGEAIWGKSTGGIVVTGDVGLRTGVTVPVVASVRQVLGASWTAITTAATIGSRLISHQQILNPTGAAVNLQLRLSGITDSPIVLGGGSTPLSLPSGIAFTAVPDLALPPGSTLEGMGNGLIFSGVANDRP